MLKEIKADESCRTVDLMNMNKTEEEKDDDEEEEEEEEIDSWGAPLPNKDGIFINSSISRFFCGEGRSQSPFGKYYNQINCLNIEWILFVYQQRQSLLCVH